MSKVGQLCEANYGVHQFLSALVRHRKEHRILKEHDIAVDIEEALNKGKF